MRSSSSGVAAPTRPSTEAPSAARAVGSRWSQRVERLVLRPGGKVTRVENFLPPEEAEAQRAFRAP
jgi:hypothetical protein